MAGSPAEGKGVLVARDGAAGGVAAGEIEERRALQRQLEEQAVNLSWSQADSQFLEQQLKERDNLLLEWSDAMAAVEVRQAALDAENERLRTALHLKDEDNARLTALVARYEAKAVGGLDGGRGGHASGGLRGEI